MKVKYWLLSLIIVELCFSNDAKSISLSKITHDKNNYNEYLINRNYGLHIIDGYVQNDSSKGMVLVHGYYPENWNTKGFEWVKPLNVLSKSSLPMWFFRYDWNECPSKTAIELKIKLKNLIIRNRSLESLIVIGHSLGGLIVTLLSEQWDSSFPMDIHSVAAGLAKSKLDRRYNQCTFSKKNEYIVSKNIKYKQWRTIKNQDGIFKYLNNDPQIVKIVNGKSELLPEKWGGIRVGHNFSIVSVSDFIVLNIFKQN